MYVCVCVHSYLPTHTLESQKRDIVHPESFRSNVQNAIAFAHKNRPRVNHSGEFACVYLHLRTFAFASTVRDQARVRTCVQLCVRELHLKCIKKITCARSAVTNFVLVTRGM